MKIEWYCHLSITKNFSVFSAAQHEKITKALHETSFLTFL